MLIVYWLDRLTRSVADHSSLVFRAFAIVFVTLTVAKLVSERLPPGLAGMMRTLVNFSGALFSVKPA